MKKLFPLLMVLLLSAGSAQALTFTWLGTVDSDWNSSSGNNWDTDGNLGNGPEAAEPTTY